MLSKKPSHTHPALDWDLEEGAQRRKICTDLCSLGSDAGGCWGWGGVGGERRRWEVVATLLPVGKKGKQGLEIELDKDTYKPDDIQAWLFGCLDMHLGDSAQASHSTLSAGEGWSVLAEN